MTQTQSWWWCLKHERVEPNEGCANAVRLGPYATREEAEQALSRAHERTDAWDEQDREWKQGGRDSSGDDALGDDAPRDDV